MWVGRADDRDLPTGAIRPSCHAAHERLSGPSWRGVAASGRRHRRYVALTKAIARSRPPCAMRGIQAAQHLLVRTTAAGHDELLATRPSRMAVAVVAHLDTARARLVISRAGGALRDPWCIRSGSLTGFSGGCHCVRCGSNFENLTGKYLGMDVVTTAVPSADAGSDASRLH